MKTLQTLKASSLLSLFAAFLLTLTSCQKDEMPVANAGTSASTDLEAAAPQLFKMLIIDHASAGTESPDYSVQLRSDGKVIFEGRNNTATAGTRTFAVTDDQMNEVKEAISGFDFLNMPVENVKAELAATTVGYKESKKKDTVYRSANDEFQGSLIQMAAKIEYILGVNLYVEKEIDQ